MGFINTIGTEIECVVPTMESMQRDLLGGRRPLLDYIETVTRDASVESRMSRMGKSSLFLGNKIMRTSIRKLDSPNFTSGCEIVTRPLEKEKMKEAISIIIPTLQKNGEVFSPRSSIHFHVGFDGTSLNFIKPALIMAYVMEPLFFKIAGMGRKYRGEINNSAFARSLDSPPAFSIEGDDDLKAVLSPLDSIKANDYHDFWTNYALDGDMGRPRYHPARYFAMNLYSLRLRGTMEYRFFNFCENTNWVTSVGALCQSVTELMVRTPIRKIMDFKTMSSTQENKNNDYHNFLDIIKKAVESYGVTYAISSKEVDNIHEIIESTPQPVIDKSLVLTHLSDFRLNLDRVKRMGLKLIDSDEVRDSGVINIHNFSSDERSLI